MCDTRAPGKMPRACYAAPKPVLEDALERIRRFVGRL
jgi:hypothetical protein